MLVAGGLDAQPVAAVERTRAGERQGMLYQVQYYISIH